MSLIDSLSKLPKWLSGSIAVVVVGLFGFGVYYLAFGMNKPEEDETPKVVTLDMPDSAESKYESTRLEAYRNGESMSNMNRVEDYWNQLGGDLVSSGVAVDENMVDPFGEPYSDYEKQLIRSGLRTREQVNADHERDRAMRAQLDRDLSGASAASRPLTQAEKDSAYFARMERAYEIAAKYADQYNGAADTDAGVVSSVEPEEEERRLELDSSPAVIPADSFGDGIVSSLDAPDDDGVVHYSGGVARKPVKATFLKNETLGDGQRVIIRLIQDMHLSDGTVIPANTHITGICRFSRRLQISVTMLHYGGRMFPVDISAYDNDGTEGIYCPSVESGKKGKQVAKQVAQTTIQAAGSVASRLLGGTPFVGTIAPGAISAVSSSLNSDGSVSVNVTAGYEFYVYENVKEN